LFKRAGVILKSRRTEKELKSHRELANRVEASRFTELRTFADENKLDRALSPPTT
jgi:hypothetical protein